ncbi:MAG: Y-family DNA polymerase [Xylophilus ampelinus]
MYCLLDANNFYVSAERIFRPALEGVPVIVLSNNDGCAISRSEEAKALGVTMGMPYFQIRQQLPGASIVALSANYGLYGAISTRLMSLAAGLGPSQEIYSIDETFIGLQGLRGCLATRARAVRERILQWVGLPCGVGIGPTKTLAKLANYVAKAAERKPGSYPKEFAQVFHLGALPASDLDAVLQATPATEVWGIGRRIGAQLDSVGIRTALDVAWMDPAAARRRWGVVFERTVRELQGLPCLELEDAPPPKQEIASTRSFGRVVTQLPDLVEAVSEFASRAAEKLRREESLAGQVLVFVHTSPFRRDDRQYSRAARIPLRRPTADTGEIVTAAVAGLERIYRPNYNFVKAGVHLLDLQSQGIEQGELGLDEDSPARARLMAAMDRINQRYGRGTLQIASAGLGRDQREWTMRQELRTPCYMTRWDEVPVARA